MEIIPLFAFISPFSARFANLIYYLTNCHFRPNFSVIVDNSLLPEPLKIWYRSAVLPQRSCWMEVTRTCLLSLFFIAV